jgi:gliding motility associated protien GldN
MKNLILLFISLLMISTTGNAQDILDGAYDRKTTYENRKVQPYPHLRQADAMWSRKVWREIDLREKVNHPFYYPAIQPGQEKVNDRRSLIDVIMDAVTEGSITAYGNAIYDDEFKIEMTQEEIKKIGGAREEIIEVPDWASDDPDAMKDTLYKVEFDHTTVKKWRLKEVWYFDKQRSVMDVRIIGICPMQEGKDEVTGEPTGFFDPLFWVYFPEARNILANTEIFNLMKNDAERRTYDDIFWKRMFSSYIIKQSNVMDRKLNEYMIGLDAVLKSEEVKAELFNIEHDLWEY